MAAWGVSRRVRTATVAGAVLAALASGVALGGTAPAPGSVSYDISYPQCGGSFPATAGLAFAVVGVNDGRPDTANPCLGTGAGSSELGWDLATGYPELYVNTADPGNSYHHQLIADWPTGSVGADPYGSCQTTTLGHGAKAATVGANSTACAWQYGYDKAQQDEAYVAAALGELASSLGPGSFPYWLDVETANTWQSGSYGQQMNTAVLQGMAYYFATPTAPGATPTSTGVYSTGYQWGQITGTPPAGSTVGTLMNLSGAADWVPGASDLAQAQSTSCASSPFTYGSVALAQWTATLDQDVVC